MDIPTPQIMMSTHETQQVIDLFIQQLLKECKGLNYYFLTLEKEYHKDILQIVELKFMSSGWHNVVCKTSSENGKSPGLTCLQLYRYPSNQKD